MTDPDGLACNIFYHCCLLCAARFCDRAARNRSIVSFATATRPGVFDACLSSNTPFLVLRLHSQEAEALTYDFESSQWRELDRLLSAPPPPLALEELSFADGGGGGSGGAQLEGAAAGDEAAQLANGGGVINGADHQLASSSRGSGSGGSPWRQGKQTPPLQMLPAGQVDDDGYVFTEEGRLLYVGDIVASAAARATASLADGGVAVGAVSRGAGLSASDTDGSAPGSTSHQEMMADAAAVLEVNAELVAAATSAGGDHDGGLLAPAPVAADAHALAAAVPPGMGDDLVTWEPSDDGLTTVVRINLPALQARLRAEAEAEAARQLEHEQQRPKSWGVEARPGVTIPRLGAPPVHLPELQAPEKHQLGRKQRRLLDWPPGSPEQLPAMPPRGGWSAPEESAGSGFKSDAVAVGATTRGSAALPAGQLQAGAPPPPVVANAILFSSEDHQHLDGTSAGESIAAAAAAADGAALQSADDPYDLVQHVVQYAHSRSQYKPPAVMTSLAEGEGLAELRQLMDERLAAIKRQEGEEEARQSEARADALVLELKRQRRLGVLLMPTEEKVSHSAVSARASSRSSAAG